MPWDIPAAIQAMMNVVSDIFKAESADEKAKRLVNQKLKENFEAKQDWDSFSARMRRFLSGLKVLLLLTFTLCAFSCGHLQPLNEPERAQWEQCKKDRQALMSHFLECMDKGDKLRGIDCEIWFESGCP